MSGRGNFRKRRYFLYRGYMTCSECGCSLTATLSKGRYTYYYCTNGKGHCAQHRKYLTESRVAELLSEKISSLSLPGKTATKSLGIYATKLREQEGSVDSVRSNLTKEFDGLVAKLSRLEDMLLEDRITKERYDIKREDNLQRQKEIKKQVGNVKSSDLETTLELLEKFKNQAVNLDTMYKNGNKQVKEELLKSILSNCEIEDQKIVSTRYKKPFAYMEGVAKSTDFDIWYT
jgi:predicted small secreted protein